MTFVDTNVVMYAVGRAHPLREEARDFFRSALEEGTVLVTSAEVLQELLHAYLPVGRLATLDAALALIRSRVAEVWPVEEDDARLARMMADEYEMLGARDLMHLASCRRRSVESIQTFDRALRTAVRS